MHRFFVPPEWIRGGRVRFGDGIDRQIVRVLRLRPGDGVWALDGRGRAFRVVLRQADRRGVWGEIVEEVDALGSEPAREVILYPALIKAERFEWLLQKGTEVGVAAFRPLLTRRTVVKAPGAQRWARWGRIVREAAEQSGRGRLPELAAPQPLTAALEKLPPGEPAAILWVGASSRSLGETLAGWSDAPRVHLFIGPEGGFAPEEVAAAREAGCAPVSVGPRILRAETAGLIAAALTLAALGELGPAGEAWHRR